MCEYLAKYKEFADYAVKSIVTTINFQTIDPDFYLQ
jgi:hypothetical protein